MIRIKTSLDHKRIRCLVWLVFTLFVLLGYSLQTAAGSAYYSMLTQNYGTVSTPPVILQNGTAGMSTIYTNSTSAKVRVTGYPYDFVDNDVSNVDSSGDKGTHSNFSAQQAGPDSTYDTLTEENTKGIEDYVDNNVSDVDGAGDKGTLSDFDNMKTKGEFATLTESFMDITYINYSEVEAASGTSAIVSKPINTAEDDFMIALLVSTIGSDPDGSTMSSAPSGWTSEHNYTQSATSGQHAYIYWKIAGASEPSSYTWTWTSDCGWVAQIITFRGVDTTSPIHLEGTVNQESSSSPMSPSVTTTEDNCMIWLYDMSDGSAVPAGGGAPSGTTWIDQTEVATPGNGLGISTAYFVQASAGATGNRDWTLGAIDENSGQQYALKPAPANYQLDQEVQFTDVIDFLSTEKLCIYAGTLGAEDLNVDFWNGTGWENLATDLTANSWNNYTVSLTSTTFTIRFKDGASSGDMTQDQWQIDASLLRVGGAGSKEDVVDQQSNVDGSADVGTHSNFTAQQYGPDSINDTLREENTGAFSSSTLLDDGFEGTPWDANWDAIASNWYEDNSQYYSGSSSASANDDNDGGFICDNLNASGAVAIYVDFWFRKSGTDLNDFFLYYYDGSGYDLIDDLDDNGADNEWLHYSQKVTDSQYFISNFRIRFYADLYQFLGTDYVWVDDVLIKKEIQDADNYELDLEVQWTSLPYLLPNENLSIYGGTMGIEDIKVDVWNGTGWETVFTDLSSGWNNASITDWLTTSNFTIRFKGGTETSDTNETTWDIDVALIHVWNAAGEENYELDLEVQWTNVDYTQANEELCIKTGTTGAEDIKVDVWNGSAWINILTDLTPNSWNNISVTSYLTSSNFTMRFNGGNETGDTSQDSWNIDATLLHIWTGGTSWLSGWDKRVKITIDHNDIDSSLSNFPVLVYLSNSSGRNNDDITFVFDEVGSDSKKIAVTKSDGTTQCYVEIEKWDDVGEQAWLWVKVPSISSTADTDLYLYYDSSQSDNTEYVGDKESNPAQNVWDSSFKGVWHLDEDPSDTAPQMRDSTSNNNDGTSNGIMTSGDQVAGKIDGSLDLDGTDDYIQTTSNELKTLDNFTLSVWFKAYSTINPHHILWEGPASENGWGDGSSPSSHEMHLTICKFDANNTLNFFYGYEDSGNWTPAVEINISFSDTTNWNHAVVVMTGAGTSPSAELFLNGVSQGTDTGTQTNRTAWDANLRIGRPGANERYFDGIIDEVRILETARSATWVKASYESGRDDLLDFASEEGTDYVDNNTSDVGSPTDRGTHSNFTAQQYGPDSVYDTLKEENTAGGITYENSAESYSIAGQSSHNFNYSLQKGSGNDRLIVVTVSWEDATGIASISSLTFDGTAITHIVNVTVGTGGYSEYISLWYLLDSSLPSSPGSYNIDVTVSEIITREIYIAVAEYSGAKQTAPDDFEADANTLPGNTAITLAAAANSSLVVAGVGEGGIYVLTNTTNIVNLQEQVFSSCGSALGHNANVNSGNVTVGWNNLDVREGMAGAVWQPASNYELDLEVQWKNAGYTQANEELCIKTGTTGAEDIKVDVWNGSAWINILTDLTPNSWNNISVTSYLTSSNFTMRFNGGNETGDTSQDSWNIDATLLHIWTGEGTSEGTYDYVLRVNNTVTDSWQIRLKKYADSNVNRLQDCTIYFHNSTDETSNQIVIENGSYINQTGPWYDLVDSETIYIAMTVQANSASTSYVYAYLEIRTPNTTTYAQYIITFEIT